MKITSIVLAVLLLAACNRDADTAANSSGPGPGGHTQQGSPPLADPSTAAGPTDQATNELANAATLTDPNRPFGHDGVAWLDSKFEVELPRSTAPVPAPLLWLEVTPTAAPVAADAQAAPRPEPVKQWTAAVVLLGRRQVFVGDVAVSTIACRADPADLCKAEALRGPTGKQVLELPAAALNGTGTVPALVTALAATASPSQPVWILADRRISTETVVQTIATLQKAGRQAIAGTATLDGQIARVFPDGTGAAAAPAGPAVAPIASGIAGVGPLPTDLSGVVVHVSRQGVRLELQRPAPHPSATPELLGNVAEALAVWAERARSVVPLLTVATISASADAPWEEVVRAADALRDTCARANKGTPCHDQRAMFARIVLVIAAPIVPIAASATPPDLQK